jgi:hypothetical protein
LKTEEEKGRRGVQLGHCWGETEKLTALTIPTRICGKGKLDKLNVLLAVHRNISVYFCILFIINSLYMFQALLAHFQEALHKDRSGTPTLVAANRHNTNAIFQLLFVQGLPKMNRQCSKHVGKVKVTL